MMFLINKEAAELRDIMYFNNGIGILLSPSFNPQTICMDILFVSDLAPVTRHPAVFEKFDDLNPGDAFLIVNDHDPKPLYYQLIAERGDIFSWTYLENGPEWWKVQIRKNIVNTEETIGEIAANDLRKAEVFKKYGIDFCCGGKKTLKEVCKDKGLDIDIVNVSLQTVEQGSQATTGNDFNRWQAGFLADYIYNQHHVYYYDVQPVITDLLAKVVAHHGTNYLELNALSSLYKTLVNELDSHFIKEENVLFPLIKSLEKVKDSGDFTTLQSQPSLAVALNVMEAEHEDAGDLLENIRHLTNNYSVPAGACNSFQLLYKKLKDLDEDLQQHIHLENNVLFPKALALEK